MSPEKVRRLDLRTLIIDDSATMRRLIEGNLRLAGLPVTESREAAHGREALVYLRTLPFDLILTDINMPIMGGLEFLERRQAERLAPGVPTAVIAVETSRSLIRRTLQLGAHAYIAKPFQPAQLRIALFPILRSLKRA